VFYAASVGCVAGVQLDDGRGVVLKALPPRYPAPFLVAVQRVQRHLAASGFPCPEPVAGPLAIGRGLALVETLLPDPGWRAPRPEHVGLSAAGLAQVVARCRDLDSAGLAPHPLDAPGDALYPEPHSPIFDFQATAAGAEWIDELARAGTERRDTGAGDAVIAHTDWSARNVRLDGRGVVAAYDWDSIAVVSETTAVGQGAATWSAIDGAEIAPSANEIADFVKSYEAVRGRPFTPDEHGAIGGAAVWVLAYTARCEHAIDPTAAVHRRARPRLRSDAALLLDFPAVMAGGAGRGG
jgi:Ser/Thr protein kinase RdoA (MazF antagonist)